jgi:monoamine oxidase
LTDALHAQFDDTVHLKTSTRVLGLKLRPHAVELMLEDASGRWSQLASQVVVTIPPRLWAQDMALEPAWPTAMLQAMQATPTWMAGQAKFVAAYPSAFWREAGLSGDGMSQRGPMSEIHDASDATGQQAALFGFVGASAAYRASIGLEELKRQSLAQLVRLFGPQAATPLWHEVQDWAQEPLTAAKADTRPLSYHPVYQEGLVPPEWRERVFLAGTERAPDLGGYLEGALESAELAVADLLQSMALLTPQPLVPNT